MFCAQVTPVKLHKPNSGQSCCAVCCLNNLFDVGAGNGAEASDDQHGIGEHSTEEASVQQEQQQQATGSLTNPLLIAGSTGWYRSGSSSLALYIKCAIELAYQLDLWCCCHHKCTAAITSQLSGDLKPNCKLTSQLHKLPFALQLLWLCMSTFAISRYLIVQAESRVLEMCAYHMS